MEELDEHDAPKCSLRVPDGWTAVDGWRAADVPSSIAAAAAAVDGALTAAVQGSRRATCRCLPTG